MRYSYQLCIGLLLACQMFFIGNLSASRVLTDEEVAEIRKQAAIERKELEEERKKRAEIKRKREEENSGFK